MKNIGNYESVHSVNPLYFIIGEVDGYIEKSNWNKYLIFAFANKNKEVLTKNKELWYEIRFFLKKKKMINQVNTEKIHENQIQLRW